MVQFYYGNGQPWDNHEDILIHHELANKVEKPVHIHDLHATALHMLGMDHTKLTYRYSGRDFRLTDVAGNVVSEILV
jgi:hypothetical protein